MARPTSEPTESLEDARLLELLRLDALQSALWPNRSDLDVAEQILRISERRAKLLGLDLAQ